MLEWLVEKVDELLGYSLRVAVALEAIALSLAPAAEDRRRLHAQAASDRTARELTAYVVHAIEGVERALNLVMLNGTVGVASAVVGAPNADNTNTGHDVLFIYVYKMFGPPPNQYKLEKTDGSAGWTSASTSFFFVLRLSSACGGGLGFASEGDGVGPRLISGRPPNEPHCT